jgi:hypothetical protein
MWVRLAAQVLSHLLAAGLYTHIAIGQATTETARLTADFIGHANTISYMLNSHTVTGDKPARFD